MVSKARAAAGIGLGIAKCLARDGYDLVLGSICTLTQIEAFHAKLLLANAIKMTRR